MKKTRVFMMPMLAAGMLFMMGGCVAREEVVAGPGPAPAPAVAYDYVYYPDAEVYFSPSVHLYYWHDDGGWHNGRALPSQIVINNETSVNVHLNTDKPYTMHDRVKAEHPGHRQPEVRPEDHHDEH